MSTDADFSLADLQSKGIKALKEQGAEPGTTYEVHPGIIGEMEWPTLRVREEFQELGGDIDSFFRDDTTPEDFRFWELQDLGVDFGNLPGSAEDLPEAVLDSLPGETPLEELERLAEEAQHPAREGVTAADFTQTTARVNCERAALVLGFDQSIEPHDMVPEMAAVVVAHFTGLVPGSGGPSSS